MKDVEGFFNIVDKLVGTPLYLIMCIGLIIFFVYYFWKVAPSRYKAFEDLIRDNSRQTAEISKITILLGPRPTSNKTSSFWRNLSKIKVKV